MIIEFSSLTKIGKTYDLEIDLWIGEIDLDVERFLRLSRTPYIRNGKKIIITQHDDDGNIIAIRGKIERKLLSPFYNNK